METILEQSDIYNPILYSGILVASNSSTLQNWKILNTEEGEMLFINNQLQSCKNDEYIYHEMFVHSLLAGCANRKKVLILGGSEGCMLREVLKWKDVESVVQVDWDTSLTNYFKCEGASWNNNSYSDLRVSIVNDDALDWLEKCRERFDCIFIDLLDPTDIFIPFFKNLFIECKNHLIQGGGISVNAGCANKLSTINIAIEFKKILENMNMTSSAMRVDVPSFKDTWTFLMAYSKAWSNTVHSCVLPSDITYYSKNNLIKSLQWSENDNYFLKNFWKDDTFVKKLIKSNNIENIRDFSNIHAC